MRQPYSRNRGVTQPPTLLSLVPAWHLERAAECGQEAELVYLFLFWRMRPYASATSVHAVTTLGEIATWTRVAREHAHRALRQLDDAGLTRPEEQSDARGRNSAIRLIFTTDMRRRLLGLDAKYNCERDAASTWKSQRGVSIAKHRFYSELNLDEYAHAIRLGPDAAAVYRAWQLFEQYDRRFDRVKMIDYRMVGDRMRISRGKRKLRDAGIIPVQLQGIDEVQMQRNLLAHVAKQAAEEQAAQRSQAGS